MKAVHILLRRNGRVHDRLADLFRQGRLHQDPVQPRIGVQLVQQREQFAFGGGFGQDVGFGKNPQFRAGFSLRPT